MRFGGLRVQNPKGINEVESPDCRNEIIKNGRLKTRLGMAKDFTAGIGNPINFMFNAKSGFCKEDYKVLIDNNGNMIIGPETERALLFNGTTSYVEFDYPVIPYGKKSISFWIQTTADAHASDVGVVLNTAAASGDYGITVYFSSDVFYIQLAYGAGAGTFGFTVAQTSTVLNDGDLHFVVFTWDGTTDADKVVLYIDNVEIDTDTATVTEEDGASSNLMIGRLVETAKYYLDGFLFDLRIFDEILSVASIDTMYDLQGRDSIGVNEGLIARYLFNEGGPGHVAENAYSIKDTSGVGAGHPVVFVGDTALSTAHVKFSTYSCIFGGTADYLNVLDNLTDFAFTSGLFTTEFWVYHTAAIGSQTNGYDVYMDYSDSIGAGHYGWRLIRTATGGLGILLSTSGTGWTFNQTTIETISSDAWHHIRVCWDGSTIYPFIDGTLATIASDSFSGSIATTPLMMWIGELNSLPYVNGLVGHIDGLHLSDGIARATSGFSVPTSAPTVDEYTVLLMNFENTRDASRQGDSNNGSPSGSPVYTEFNRS